MKKLLLFSALVFSCALLAQQQFQLDKDCFIIGMFNDYNAITVLMDHPKESTKLTTFFGAECELRKIFTDSLRSFYKTKDIIVEKHAVFSKELAPRFNAYYTIKNSSGYGATIDEKDYDIYSCLLNKEAFPTDNQKISFLLGTYVRYGQPHENNFQLKLANSPSHYSTAVAFLKNLGFKVKELPYRKDNIPLIRTVSFTPPEKYLALFQKSTLWEHRYENCD